MPPVSKRDIIVLCAICVAAMLGLSWLSLLTLPLALICGAAYCALIILYFSIIRPYINTVESQPLTPLQETALLKEQTKLVDGFAEAILIIDRHERVLYANPSAKALFPHKNVGGTVGSIFSSRDVKALAVDLLAGKDAEAVTFKVNTPVERHFRVTGKQINTDSSRPQTHVRAILVFYDITEIMRINTMRAEFLANASHELKTPIASLLGYIETLRGHAKDDPEAQETFLQIMQQQAERMQRLIADLLSLRRIELVEHLAPTQTADLYLATRAAIEAVEPLAKANNVTLSYSGPKYAPVTGIQDELVQLVLNLLDNAVAFTRSGGTVSLTLNTLPEWQAGQIFSEDAEFATAHKRRIVIPANTDHTFAALRIKDEGPGVDPQGLSRIGERFYKVVDKDHRAQRGTGLGLAIVKHITLRHRGGLFVESLETVGTKFTILLPDAS